jgi:hypothetical protein
VLATIIWSAVSCCSTGAGGAGCGSSFFVKIEESGKPPPGASDAGTIRGSRDGFTAPSGSGGSGTGCDGGEGCDDCDDGGGSGDAFTNLDGVDLAAGVPTPSAESPGTGVAFIAFLMKAYDSGLKKSIEQPENALATAIPIDTAEAAITKHRAAARGNDLLFCIS